MHCVQSYSQVHITHESIPYKVYRVHNNYVVDQYYYYNPIIHVWIVQKSGFSAKESIVQKLEQKLAQDGDLDFCGLDNPQMTYYNGHWMQRKDARSLCAQEICE